MRGNPFSMHQPDALEEQQLRNQEVRLYQAVDRLTALVTVLQKRPAAFPQTVSRDMPDFFDWQDEPPFV